MEPLCCIIAVVPVELQESFLEGGRRDRVRKDVMGETEMGEDGHMSKM